MKKLMNLGILMAVLVMMAGCVSTRTTSYFENGVLKKVVEEKKPSLVNKSVEIDGKAVGLTAAFYDPQTGTWAPTMEMKYGKGHTGTVPVTSGNDNVVEVFGTYKEILTYDKSMWGAEIGSLEYSLTAGGAGVFAIGTESKEQKIALIISRINDLKAAVDKAKASIDAKAEESKVENK